MAGDSPVKAWSEPVVIPTYLPKPADRNPMFLEKRVYQGSSGKVYPLPFIDRIAEEKVDHTWQAVYIENEFLRLMILPELGGRIHTAQDKTNGYDFIYRQNVIKPALVGLAGPWISGGIEFNWPQHHRPSTFMPAEVKIENHSDGSVTVWLSEHEPMNRMKGMHGVCLHPGRSFIELKVRLYNRTPLVQTFLWWANVATRVHERYQSFFPPDVHYVADHAKRAMSAFPRCGGFYYGVDYGSRPRSGVPAEQRPRMFVPSGGYPANDLSWYANIPVPTSYMCTGTRQAFFGGYDHAADAGIVHYANPHISPGKKQWTWGNHEFGYAWDRNLTDADGPYIEIMAGVYTDNQPDFSFLHPYETRVFSQYWYPIQKIGPAQQANRDAAIGVRRADGQAHVGVCTTRRFEGAIITLEAAGKEIGRWPADIEPGKPFLQTAPAPAGQLRAIVRRAGGDSLLEYIEPKPSKGAVPPPATEPPIPKKIKTNEQLYLTGLHLEQYRHGTRSPAAYWEEALRRDPGDARCSNAMGLWRLRRGEFDWAEEHFRAGIARLTALNPNPYDGELYYNLGLALRWLGRDEEAYAAFYKSTWNYAWQSAAFYALAQLDCRAGNWTAALEHLERSPHANAGNLKATILRKLGRPIDAILAGNLAADPLDAWACWLSGQAIADEQIRLDVAFDLAAAGFDQEAVAALRISPSPGNPGEGWGEGKTGPMTGYVLSFLGEQSDQAVVSPDSCFPSRLEEMQVLQSAIAKNLRDAKAPYYLGNLLYDRRRHEEAIRLWEKSARLDPNFSIVWRNLGIGYYNIRHDARRALRAYDRAVAAAPGDARLWYERDQLQKRTGEKPQPRLALLSKRMDLVMQRDDLSVEVADLYNQTGEPAQALQLLASRRFQPWEGGEGAVLAQYVRAHLALGQAAVRRGNAGEAIEHFQSSLTAPENLGQARHVLSNPSNIHYWLGEAYNLAEDRRPARRHWTAAAEFAGDFREMAVKPFSEMTYYRALAMKRLGRRRAAAKLFRDLLAYAKKLAATTAKIDYFATSLPTMLIFDDDLQRRQTVTATFLQAQALLGLGKLAVASRLLKKVLRMDQNHAMARDLLWELTPPKIFSLPSPQPSPGVPGEGE